MSTVARLLGGVAGFVALVAMLVGLLGAAPAAAQDTGTNSLQSIVPAPGANLESSPEEIVLSFNQEIQDGQVAIVQMTCGVGEIQSLGEPEVDDNGLVVTVEVLSPVPRGACTIIWALRDDAATVAQDSSTFRVDSDPATTTTTTTAAPGAATTTTIASQPLPGAGRLRGGVSASEATNRSPGKRRP